jgi:hypothetical protein
VGLLTGIGIALPGVAAAEESSAADPTEAAGLEPFGGFGGPMTPGSEDALIEFHNRLRPEALAPDGAGGLWFVGTYGVGTIAADGKVRELRVGGFYELPIGGGHYAVAGPEGDLWFIGGATPGDADDADRAPRRGPECPAHRRPGTSPSAPAGRSGSAPSRTRQKA